VVAPDRLIERRGDLKSALLDYAHEARFKRTRDRAVAAHFAVRTPDEYSFAGFLDFFVRQARLPDGRTIVAHFVADHPELPEDEREMRLGWQDVVESVFKVERRDGNAVMLARRCCTS
jgi:hypothetical protein